MTVDAFHYYFCSIDINPVFRAELNGTESDSFFVYMYKSFLIVEQFQSEQIKVGMFTIPGADACSLADVKDVGKTFFPLVFHYVIPITILGGLIALGVLPIANA